jgi:hypothetical protein
MKQKDAEKWVELALIGVAIYVGYKVVSGIGSTLASGVQAGSNFDQNIGLGPFDSWVSSLFQAPTS